MEQKLIAFWKYDLFPYCLGGEVEYFNDNGSVRIKEYHCSFRPIKIFPFDSGSLVLEDLKKLKDEYDNEMNEVTKKYKDKLPIFIRDIL